MISNFHNSVHITIDFQVDVFRLYGRILGCTQRFFYLATHKTTGAHSLISISLIPIEIVIDLSATYLYRLLSYYGVSLPSFKSHTNIDNTCQGRRCGCNPSTYFSIAEDGIGSTDFTQWLFLHFFWFWSDPTFNEKMEKLKEAVHCFWGSCPLKSEQYVLLVVFWSSTLEFHTLRVWARYCVQACLVFTAGVKAYFTIKFHVTGLFIYDDLDMDF